MGNNDYIEGYWQSIHRASAVQHRQSQAHATAARVDPDAAARIGEINRAYPHISSGTVRGLAQAGFGPDSPEVVYAAFWDAAQQAESPQGFDSQYGDPINFTRLSSRQLRGGGLTGQERNRAMNARLDLEEQVLEDEGINLAPTFEEMTNEELAPILASMPQMTESNLLGGQGDRIGMDQAERLLESHRDDAIAFIRRKTGQEQRSLFSRSPAAIFTDAASDTGRETDNQIAAIPGLSHLYTAGKAAVRTGTMAANFPIQELNSVVRNIYGLATGSLDKNNFQGTGEATDIGVALGQNPLQPWEGSGQGFFVDPDSEVARLRREREILAGNIGGHVITPGRIFANQFTEPDTEPFNFISGVVDAGVTWYGDPVGIMNPGAAIRARRTFQIGAIDEAYEAAGMVNGIRKYVMPQQFDQWITHNMDRVETFRDLKSPYLIDQATGFQLGPEVSNRLARANTDKTVMDTMRSVVNQGKIRQTTQFTGSAPFRLRQSWGQTLPALRPSYTNRLTARLPGNYINITDKTLAAEQARRILVNAKVPEEQIQLAYDGIAQATTPSGVLSTLHSMVDDVRDATVRKLGDPDSPVHSALIALRDTRNKDDVQSLVQTIGADHPNIHGVIVNGETIPIMSAHHSLQALSDWWEVTGDPRAIRRVTSSIPILNSRYRLQPIKSVIERNGGLPNSMLEGAMTFLKSSWLLRLAWPVRFVAEEQIRIANSPLDLFSAFDHPIKYMSLQLGRTHTLTPMGNPIDELEEFNKARVHGHGGWVGQQTSTPRGRVLTYAKDNAAHRKDFDYSWANELAHLQQHPVVNHLLNNSRQETLDWLMKGKGKSFLRHQREVYGGLQDSAQIDNWLTTITDNVRQLTNDDADLIGAIRNGNYQGVPVYLDDLSINSDFRKIVAAHHDLNAPQFINGMSFTTTKGEMDSVMDHIWGVLFTFPANRFGREPVFRQALWTHTRELIGGATKSAKAKILAIAEESGLSGEEMARLREAAKATTGGRLTQEAITDLAKGYALDDVKNLLYDLTERRQWADIARIIVPFGDAYQEILQSWSRIITGQAGKPIHRLSQIVTAARSPGSGETLGTGVEGGGFFWEDEHGTEMFNYPMSGAVTNWLTGVNVPLSGRVQGLNMVGNFLPGLGPVAQLPAAYFIDKYKNLEPLRDLLVPFGAPGSGESELFNVLNYGPAWMRKFVQAAGSGYYNQRLYNNQVMASYAYLISTGDFGNTPEELQRAMEQATSATRKLHWLTAFGAFILPSSPTMQELVKDKSNTLVSVAAISRDYWTKVDEEGYEQANGWFLANFGEDAVGAIVPRTASTSMTIPRTVEQGEWWKAHPGLADQYPQIYGFFGPQGGEFDYTTYIESILSGQRESLTPQEFVRVMDDWMGNYWYGRVIDDTGGDNPTDDDSFVRRRAAEQIQADYPYWDRNPGTTGLPRRAEPEELIRDFERAMGEETFRETRAGEAIFYYMDARRQANEETEAYNSSTGSDYASFQDANDLSYIRGWLRGVAERILTDYPEFQPAWDMVFSRELSEDPFTG